MGGIGSGMYRKFTSKPTTEDFYSLDLRKLNKLVPLDQNCQFTLEWRKSGKSQNVLACRLEGDVLELNYAHSRGGESVSVTDCVGLTTTPCNFGGVRKWFVCPGCNKRALVLYSIGRFRCRKCHNLYHPSSNEGELFRATRALCKYQDKLGGTKLTAIDGINGLSKPKWMRYPTYLKLQSEVFSRSKLFSEYYKRTFL